jgi:hypothetical protein
MHKARLLEKLFATVSVLSTMAPGCALARGPSPYLPLHLSPQIERQIERVLILADKPVIRRPIAAATVLDALPKACAVDTELCSSVRNYLRAYMQDRGVTLLETELAAMTGNSTRTIPNSHGEREDSNWQIAASAYYQPNDYVLLNIGGVAYDGRATPTGSMLSVGFDWAQLDVGFRDHWFSPLSDSSALISTQAPTMPSITLSNYEPISFLGINYELFLAELSKQDNIAYQDTTTSGHPRLSGLQIGMEPVSGYSVSLNRVLQYGGGARGYGGLSGLIDAFYKNSNRPDASGNSEFGNQVASLTSSIIFPGAVPFAVRAEYAGEDNAYAGRYRLGATNLSLGIDFPRLWRDFDFSFETSEWQTAWYIHHIYPLGLTNHGHVIGHWFGDERRFGDAIPGSSQMLRFGWTRESGDYFQAIYRTLKYEPFSTENYERMHEATLSYTRAWRGRTIDAEISAGQDVFGDDFARLALSIDFADRPAGRAGPIDIGRVPESSTEVFVDIGATNIHALQILGVDIPNRWTPTETNFHGGIGARRRVSRHSDLGARLEFDNVNGYQLTSLRALDYRYRINRKLAAGAFFGAGRYDIGLPAYGYYWGIGLQLMDVLPKWDISLDARHHEKLGRDKMLPEDPPSTPDRTRIFFDVDSTSLYISRRF